LLRYLPILIFFLGLAVPSMAGSLPDAPRVPDSLGVNIHFIHPAPREMERLSELGVRWIRMDMIWQNTETAKGVYDFSAYDVLTANLDRYGIKAMFILDYGNSLYDGGLAPHSEEARKAFARWAVAAASHYRGKGYIWEIWNEPNLDDFWKPKSNPKSYVALALETSKAFKERLPDETLIGPAISHFDLDFLKKCFQAGLLEYWDGVSVHPYRAFLNPETAGTGYRRAASLIARYAPSGKKIPLLSGEWGYSSVQFWLNQEKQAKFLARQWLFNLSEGIPLSIWYDWTDDGDDPRANEHHFGLAARGLDFPAKPAFLAAQALTSLLRGYRFAARLPSQNRDYLLAFERDGESRWAVWTSSPKLSRIFLAVPAGEYEVWDYLGKEKFERSAGSHGLPLTLRDQPQYIIKRAAHP